MIKMAHPIGWFHEHIWEKVFVQDQVVGATVLQQGPVVVPRLVSGENSEKQMTIYSLGLCGEK